MSFVDGLRQNYDPDGKKMEEEQLQGLIDSIVLATLRGCDAASKSKRRLQGYYCSGYDESEIALNGQKLRFVYETDFGPHRAAIEAYNGKFIAQYTYGRDVPGRIVRAVKARLEAEGFVNPIVRAEETTKQFKYGHTQFMHREKFDEFPAFAIYVDVTW